MTLSSLGTLLRRWFDDAPGVRIEERRWQRSIDALHRDCEGLKRRIRGNQRTARRR